MTRPEVRPMPLLLILACLVLIALSMAGCKTAPGSFNSDPTAQAAVAALVDVAVGEAVQKGVSAASMAEIAKELEAFDTGQAVTIPALTAEIQALVVKANLNPGEVAAVTILETTLDALISQQIQAARSSAPSSAPSQALSATTITTINIVLQDVITAAQIYMGQGVPLTAGAPQNKHFILAAVESPSAVGAATSLVLIASLQAFAHVQVASPVGAAITVLATIGAALIDNLVS